MREFDASEGKAIIRNGGMGLLTHLVHNDGVITFSPEPPDAYERKELEKQFSRDEIEYYYFARMAYQWCKKGKQRPDFEKYLCNFSIPHMEEIHKNIFSKKLDCDDEAFLYKIINPNLLNLARPM